CEAVLCFCFCTIDSLAKLGIVQTAAQQEATLCAWKTVGHLLGLSEALQPVDVAEARALHKQLFERSCRETREAQVLIEEVVHIMRCMMPRGLRRVPATLMRYLLGRRVADQLAVPNDRLLLGALGGTHWLWGERQVFAKLARLTSPSVVRWMTTCEAARSHPLLAEDAALVFGSPRL
ncbi:MAG: oxygenase MpaB family protein, partial [Acidobacteriota bacterium]